MCASEYERMCVSVCTCMRACVRLPVCIYIFYKIIAWSDLLSIHVHLVYHHHDVNTSVIITVGDEVNVCVGVLVCVCACVLACVHA